MPLKRKPLCISTKDRLTTERSDKIHSWWRDSSERYDYFITGLGAALAGYVGKSATIAVIGLNQPTLELASAAAFIGSFIFGLRRIEQSTLLTRLTSDRIYHHDSAANAEEVSRSASLAVDYARGELWLPEQLREKAAEHRSRGKTYEELQLATQTKALSMYKWRDRFLIGGFLFLVASRLLPAILR